MTPVMQTTFGEGSGNCYPACLASILEVSLESIPNFCCDTPKDEDWTLRTQEWLRQFGLGVVTIRYEDGMYGLPNGALTIATGPSPREGVSRHCVVGRVQILEDGRQTIAMLHDPHPSAEFLTELEVCEFLIQLDPSQTEDAPCP